MQYFRNLLRSLAPAALIAALVAIWVLLPVLVLLGCALVLATWMAATRPGRQAAAVTWVGILTLPQRLGASSVIVIGIAGVVGVLVALLALGGGLAATLRGTGNNETAIVLRGGATAELDSGLTREDATLILQAPGIAHDAEGRTLGTAEITVVTNVAKKSNHSEANVEIRGSGRRCGPCVRT